MNLAKFICIDGLDGLGKSTQLTILSEWLTSHNIPNILCVDPGGTPLGGMLREILLQSKENIAPRCEALLFMASRAQLVSEVIQPSLAKGQVVLSDRFTTANIVYQGYACGLPLQELRAAVSFSASGIVPDLTIILDAPVEIGWARRGRDPDRMESRGQAFLQKVRDGFLSEARLSPDTFAIVDASKPLEQVCLDIRKIIEQKFAEWGYSIN